MNDTDTETSREIKRHQTRETLAVVMVLLALLWLVPLIAVIVSGDIRMPSTLIRKILAIAWSIVPLVAIPIGFRSLLRHHRAITTLMRQNRPAISQEQMTTKVSPRLSRKQAAALIAIGAGLGLICLIQYWRVQPSEEEMRTRPQVFVVTQPTTLAEPFFGVALGRHTIKGEFLDKKWSEYVMSVFFLVDPNGTPFKSDLPSRIGVDPVTARLGKSIAYSVAGSIKTHYAWTMDLGGSIVVFVDNASDSDILVTVDSQEPRRLSPYSHAKVTLGKGIHTFASRQPRSTELTDSHRVFLSDYDRGASGKQIEWYIYNVGRYNMYDLQSAQYIPVSQH